MAAAATAISSVVVAGDGIVGWSAAAALKRRLPKLNVTVVRVTVPANALADRIGCTLPSILDFHQDLGLTDADTVGRAGSGYRLGTQFKAWTDGHPAYVHAYGEYGQPIGGTAFHQQWLRSARCRTAVPFDSFSLSAQMAANGRFSFPRVPDGTLPSFSCALHVDPPSYREMMRAFALHLGAMERPGGIASVSCRSADGFIDSLELDDGSAVTADLYVDATGPPALVRSALGGAWDDWRQWLIADRLLIADGPGQADAPVLDKAIALDAGWRWEAASSRHSSSGVVYSSTHLGEAEARAIFRDATGTEATQPTVAIHSGRLAEPWLLNCVAIGDAAVAIEPLEWTNLHLAHSAIDRIVAMMPDRDCSPIELADYNRQAVAEADRARDFVLLHYATANRSGAFWADAASRPLPDSLQHTLTQFRERGRLPFYEEETFARDSWLAVLLGQGVRPRRLDPLAESLSEEQSMRAMARIQAAITAAVRQSPPQSDYLRTVSARTAS